MCTLEINPSRVFAEQLQQQKSDESNAIGRGCYREKEAALIAQLVKNLAAMWETWVRSLGWGDLLEKGKATHSSILAWRIP